MNSSKDENNICTKTAQELSEMIGCHRNSVGRAVEELADFGIVGVFNTLSIKNRPKYAYKILDEDSLINKWAQKEIEVEDYHLYQSDDPNDVNPQEPWAW